MRNTRKVANVHLVSFEYRKGWACLPEHAREMKTFLPYESEKKGNEDSATRFASWRPAVCTDDEHAHEDMQGSGNDRPRGALLNEEHETGPAPDNKWCLLYNKPKAMNVLS